MLRKQAVLGMISAGGSSQLLTLLELILLNMRISSFFFYMNKYNVHCVRHAVYFVFAWGEQHAVVALANDAVCMFSCFSFILRSDDIRDT